MCLCPSRITVLWRGNLGFQNYFNFHCLALCGVQGTTGVLESWRDRGGTVVDWTVGSQRGQTATGPWVYWNNCMPDWWDLFQLKDSERQCWYSKSGHVASPELLRTRSCYSLRIRTILIYDKAWNENSTVFSYWVTWHPPTSGLSGFTPERHQLDSPFFHHR